MSNRHLTYLLKYIPKATQYVFIAILLLTFSNQVISQTFDIYEGDTINRVDKKGRKQGQWVNFVQQEVDSANVKIIKSYKYQEGEMLNDLKEGVWKVYYPSGNPKSVTKYKKGAVYGSYYTFYENGNRKLEATMGINGNVGLMSQYYENGKTKSKFMYDTHGEQEDIQKTFHENGELKSYGYMRKGKKNGAWATFDENGKIIKSVYYIDGKEDKKKNRKDKLLQLFAEGSNLELQEAENENELESIRNQLEQKKAIEEERKQHALEIAKKERDVKIKEQEAEIALSEKERIENENLLYKQEKINNDLLLQQGKNELELERKNNQAKEHELNLARAEREYQHVQNQNKLDSMTAAQTIHNNEIRLKNEKERTRIEKAKVEAEKNKRYFLTISMVLVIVVLSVVALIFIQKNKAQKTLTAKNKQLFENKISQLLNNQELASINSMLAGQEKERKRIARDIHDNLGSLMSTIKLYVTALLDNQPSIPNNSSEFKHTTELLDRACDEVRKISHSMNSGGLIKFELQEALENLQTSINKSKVINMYLDLHGLDERLEGKTALALYRVIQELVSNSIKHSGATELTVQVNKSDYDLNLIVEDNGKGFEVKKSGSGMGIKNVRSRIKELDGVVEIDSAPKRGTSVIIDIPLLSKEIAKLLEYDKNSHS